MHLEYMAEGTGGVGSATLVKVNSSHSGAVLLADDKTYKAEYHGSGTFVISKPKRKSHKQRQSRVKNPQRGARR